MQRGNIFDYRRGCCISVGLVETCTVALQHKLQMGFEDALSHEKSMNFPNNIYGKQVLKQNYLPKQCRCHSFMWHKVVAPVAQN